ncbi:MAG: large conductance mechanosensitive channel protein MscL [Sphingosinicella sp.]
MDGFREFIARGNVVDLAVGVIVGASFGAIVTSLTGDMIMPVIGALSDGVHFSNFFVRLGPIPAGFTGNPASYAELKEAGVPMLGYGEFLTVIMNFLFLAFIVYQLVKLASRIRLRKEQEEQAASEEVVLLREIRDSLKARG